MATKKKAKRTTEPTAVVNLAKEIHASTLRVTDHFDKYDDRIVKLARSVTLLMVELSEARERIAVLEKAQRPAEKPVDVLRVGDIIKTEGHAKSVPVGTTLSHPHLGDLYVKIGSNRWQNRAAFTEWTDPFMVGYKILGMANIPTEVQHPAKNCNICHGDGVYESPMNGSKFECPNCGPSVSQNPPMGPSQSKIEMEEKLLRNAVVDAAMAWFMASWDSVPRYRNKFWEACARLQKHRNAYCPCCKLPRNEPGWSWCSAVHNVKSSNG